MRCKNCEKTISSEAKFCRYCGERVNPTQYLSKATDETSQSDSFWKRLFKTRLDRKNFIIGIVLSYMLYYIFCYLLGIVYGSFINNSMPDKTATTLALLTLPPFLFLAISISIRRLHDTKSSGYNLLLIFVPLGNIYLYYMLLFKGGDKEKNGYGPKTSGKLNLNNIFGLSY